MRKDIFEQMELLKKDGIKPNYSEIARQRGCDYRTVKRYFETNYSEEKKERKKQPSKLDGFKDLIMEKIDDGCTQYSIYKFIEKKGYKGKYSLLNAYCKKYKDNEIKKANIRFETNPGLQAQVDWKEEVILYSRSGVKFKFNIFLMLLGYSREKYIELTLTRSQDTLMSAMINGFHAFGGVPKEIIFDNMKTVINQSKTEYKKAVINEKFYQFSKDMGFEVWACRPYRPMTKGKVEALAKLCDRLQVYNHEFDTIEDLKKIVKEFQKDINEEVSRATNEKPNERFKKEKEYLRSLPNQNILDTYLTIPIIRKVTKESMIEYKKQKYSLPTYYIGKTVEIKENDNFLIVFLDGIEIFRHEITDKKYNYDENHLKEILKSDAMKHQDEKEIEEFAKKQMKLYDSLEA